MSTEAPAVTPKKRTPNNVCPVCGGKRVLILSRRFFFFWRMPRKWVCVAQGSHPSR